MFGRQSTDEIHDENAPLNDQQAAYVNDLAGSESNDVFVPGTPDSFSDLPQDEPLVGSAAPRVEPIEVDHVALLDIKQSALNELSPLVDHLNQSPEEKFRTTMMLIQASDNAGLIKQAHSAAKQITDDKARAQALLDVVNEINYFTNKSHINSAQ